MNVVNYTLDSELSGGTRQSKNRLTARVRNICNSSHFSSKLPYVLREREIDLKSTNLNKIFTGQWLDERRCIMGTKCNQLLVMDTVTGKYSIQTPLKSPPESKDIQNHCGIHSISINPSRTLLATGASNVNDVAIYSLPHLEPVAVGFKAHSYWIFDLAWLNDEYVVSGSGDNRLALWKTTPSSTSSSSPLKSIFSNSITSRKRSSNLPATSSQEEYNASACAALNLINKQKQSYLTDRWLKRPFSYSFTASAATSSSYSTSPAHRLTSSFLMPSSFAPIPNRIISFLTSSPNTSRVSRNDDDTSESDSDDNDRDDDDDEEHSRDDSDSDQSMSSQSSLGDDNQSFNFHTAPTSSSNHSNLVIFDDWSTVNSNMESDDQLGQDEVSEDILDEDNQDEEDVDDDDDDQQHDHSYEAKRRRLNSLGKFRSSGGGSSPAMSYLTPTKVIKCRQSKRIRALAFNPKRNEIAAISMNSAFHYFDIHRFEQKYTKKLSMLKENVCLSLDSDYSTYAIGSASHVQLLDANNAMPIVEPVFVKKDIGIRSLHFRNKVLSVGTGMGSVLFYDLRVNRFLPSPQSETEPYKLQTTGGWILRNQTYYENLPFGLNNDNSHAIYSHSYDPSGTKMLTVGGPLTVNLYGNYMGIWR